LGCVAPSWQEIFFGAILFAFFDLILGPSSPSAFGISPKGRKEKEACYKKLNRNQTATLSSWKDLYMLHNKPQPNIPLLWRGWGGF
jgi:hypothetical protein